MSSVKQSFVLYNDYIDITDELSDEEAGIIFKMIMAKVNGREDQGIEDRTLRLVFKPIEKALVRDLQKYENKLQEKSNAGSIGNLKRWHLDLYEDFRKGKIDLEEALNIAKHRKTSHSDNSIANVADSDSDSDSGPGTENVSENVNDYVDENEKIGLNANARFFLKNNKMVNAFIEDFRLKEPKNLIAQMKAYHRHLEKNNTHKKTPKDYRNHLDNWLRKKEEVKKMANEPKTVAGYSSEDVDRMYNKLRGKAPERF